MNENSGSHTPMSQKLEQLVALATYGNLYLQDHEGEFDIEQFVTHHCHGLDFIDPPIEGIAGSEKVLASDTSKWFSYLKSQDAKRIKLHYTQSSHTDLPDHLSAAFAGGGSRWFIEVQFEGKSHLYLGGWVPTEGSVSDAWKTHHVRIERDIDHIEDLTPSVTESREQIGSVLKNLSGFAGRFDHTKNWVDNFNSALETLEKFDPQVSDDFIPAGIYSKDARQLIETAFRSWVFGGMGSWNDFAFSGDDQDQYTTLSKKLYSIVCQSIVSGVNSYT